MRVHHLALAALLLSGLTSSFALAQAQTKVFVIDEAAIRANSKVGKEIAATIESVRKEGVTKLGLETLGKEIKTEDDALKPQVQSLSKEALAANATLKARVEALDKKKNEFLQKANVLDQALAQQETAANQAFTIALQPAVDFAAKEAAADVVLSISSTWYIKSAVDLSPKVVARLDATTPTLAALKAATEAAMAKAQPAAGAAPAAPKP